MLRSTEETAFPHCPSRTLQVWPVAMFILETIFISVFKMLKTTASLTTAYIQGLESYSL